MIGQKYLICFTTLFLAWNAAAFIPNILDGGGSGGGVAGGLGGVAGVGAGLGGGLGGAAGVGAGLGGGLGALGGLGGGLGGLGNLKPCFTPDSCKNVMSQAFQVQYKVVLTAFLTTCVTTLEQVALQLKATFAVDSSMFSQCNIIAEAAITIRKMLENPVACTNEKLAQIITEIKAHWATIFQICPDRSIIQSHLDTIAKAFYTMAQLVIKAWTLVSPVAGIFASQLTGFTELNAEVVKCQNLPYNEANVNIFSALVSRVLVFFGVDVSIIYTFTFPTA